MGDLNYLALAIVVVAAFVVSTTWYMIFGKQYAEQRGLDPAEAAESPAPWMIPTELVRTLVVAIVVAGLADQMGLDNVGEGLLLGLVLWVAFPLIYVTGSVMWDKVSWKLAAIHGGDWFLKLGLVAAVVTAWQ